MMKRFLTLGYSTCPNDTFMFHALAHGLIDCKGLSFDIRLADVERLNQWAETGTLDVTKLSVAAFGRVQDRYALLGSGAALGRGCGPLIVARQRVDLTRLGEIPIAVPGLGTTAYLLLCLYLGKKPRAVPMTFNEILPAIRAKQFEAGVIIHEGRFTYESYGMVCIQDLGQWWEEYTGMPIPLGAIAIRRDLPGTVAESMERLIETSVAYALKNPDASGDYIRRHAAELDPQVIRRHIDLYVNRFSVDLGEEGKRAVETLFRLARQRGALPENDAPLFAVPDQRLVSYH
jgi:1,4-dihydroxy-6-naphthoate synthase